MPKLGLGLSLPQTRVASAPLIPTSGLSLWLKADAGVTLSGSDVTAWADQSGNGKNATSFAGQPTLSTFNGKSFVSFPAESGLANYLGIWSETDLIIGTIIMVARFQSSGSSSRLFGHDPTMLFARDQQDKLFTTIDDISGGISDNSLSNNTNYLIGTSFDTNLINFYLNGIDDGNLDGQTQYGTAPYVIGGYSGSSSIAEIVVYNRVLTTPERQQVEQYLNSKYQIYPWRITISGAGTTTSNGEYVWDGVTLEAGNPKYISTNGNYIYWNTSYWSIWDFDLDRATYISYGNLTSWEIDDASEPPPSATLYYTP
jgi:hypothetical protein